MPAPVLRSELAARIRVAADQPNAGGKFPDAVLFPMIEEGVSSLYDLLIAGMGADYYSNVVTLNTVPGTAEVDLPDDFYRLESVLINPAPAPIVLDVQGRPVLRGDLLPSGWHELPRLVHGQLARRRNLGGTSSRDFVYATTGVQHAGKAQLRLYPTPRATFALQLIVIPACTHTESSGDVLYDGLSGWEAYVIAYVVADMGAIVEDSVSAYWQGKMMQQQARIAALAGTRDQAQPEQVADRTGDCGDTRYDHGSGCGGRGFDDSWV